MWKESYRIGVDTIDQQHQSLFTMVDELLRAIDSQAGREEYEKVIGFMKEYVVSHFRDEEAYQESIHYSGLKEHQEEYRDFTEEVLKYEKWLVETKYDLRVVKDFAGTLTTWLIYHVCDSDQKIVGGPSKSDLCEDRSYLDSFVASVRDVLEKMGGFDDSKTKETKGGNGVGDLFVEVGLIGDLKGGVTFGFTQELAFRLIEAMTFMVPDEIDEMVCSAMAEVANISSGNAVSDLAQNGMKCDITTPNVSMDKVTLHKGAKVKIDTEIGGLELSVSLK